MDSDTVKDFKVRLKIGVLLVLTPIAVWTDGAILAVLDHGRARRICKSSVRGAVEKVASDSLEKKLPSTTAERRTVSASSMGKQCELDGSHA